MGKEASHNAIALVTAKTQVGLASLGSSGEVPAPFATTIVLVEDCVIAGTTHVADIESVVHDLEEGSTLNLSRDPTNAHDRWATKVMDKQGRRVGWLPVAHNEVLARLMDGGKHLFCKVTSIELVGSWHKIMTEVVMDD